MPISEEGRKRQRATQFQPLPGEELSRVPLCVKLPVEVDRKIRAMPAIVRSGWMRKVLSDAAAQLPEGGEDAPSVNA